MKQKNNFNLAFMATSFGLLVVVATLNFIFDGDSLYLKRFTQSEITAFSDPKVFAITELNIDERVLKKQILSTLSKRQKPDCVFLGSSRAMLISTIYGTAPKNCTTGINLALSGAGVEDVVLMAYYLAALPKQQHPEVIYIGLSHWSFRWGAEESWKVLSNDFDDALQFFTGQTASFEIPDSSLLINLLSFDYLLHSIERFVKNGFSLRVVPFKSIHHYFVPAHAPASSSILKDGSRLYSKEQRMKHGLKPATGLENYKISQQIPDESVYEMYMNIARHFDTIGIETVFFALPFHSTNTKVDAALFSNIMEAQKFVDIRFGGADFSMRGAFLMDRTPCNDGEMLDFMHPSRNCVEKILKSTGIKP